MQRCIQLTDTNSPCGLFFSQPLSSLSIIHLKISLVSIEKRVYPIPFRTRQSSSSSPMILHTLVWESRPMPRFSLGRSSSDGLSSFKSPAQVPCLRGAFVRSGGMWGKLSPLIAGLYPVDPFFVSSLLPFIFFCHTVPVGKTSIAKPKTRLGC